MGAAFLLQAGPLPLAIQGRFDQEEVSNHPTSTGHFFTQGAPSDTDSIEQFGIHSPAGKTKETKITVEECDRVLVILLATLSVAADLCRLARPYRLEAWQPHFYWYSRHGSL